ncbi:hypothetical protein HWB51_gp074 [Mycobacterium phage Cuke]|uniref:Uncharacterized protein n=1 Tax=Mycobacterium phage Cuke TaxID=2079417 RepID=A0A2L1IX42_9CAUD|nr:hypothetical protein HWB51_gp074 [Mycobacterium phage Cuke]AVD99738.1 hypothetical protein SEA_CUKE_122 [Mycobacterium phage Cuke]
MGTIFARFHRLASEALIDAVESKSKDETIQKCELAIEYAHSALGCSSNLKEEALCRGLMDTTGKVKALAIA